MVFGGKSTKCRKVRHILSEYIDGQLDEELQNVVERHVVVCEDCAAELESLRMTVQLLNQVPSVPTPRSFAIRELDLEQEPGRKPSETGWIRPVPVLAGALGGKAVRVFSPPKLRWLTLATSFVVAALVLLLVLDYVQVIPIETGGDRMAVTAVSEPTVLGPLPGSADDDGNVSLAAGNESVETGGIVSQVRGNDSLGFMPPPAPPEVIKDVSIKDTDSTEPLLGDGDRGIEAVSGEPEAQWVRYVEVAMAAIVLLLVMVLLFLGSRYRRRSKV